MNNLHTACLCETPWDSIGGAKMQRFKAMDSTTRVLADSATALNSAPEQGSGPNGLYIEVHIRWYPPKVRQVWFCLLIRPHIRNSPPL